MNTLERYEKIHPILKYYVDAEEIEDDLNDYLETIIDEPFDNDAKTNFQILEILMENDRINELFDHFVVLFETSNNLYPLEQLERIVKRFLPSQEQINRQIEYLNSLKKNKLIK